MSDVFETIGNSLINHGKENNRVYLMKIDKHDCLNVLEKSNELALAHGYEKLFAKVPKSLSSYFENDGFKVEAAVPNFFRGEEDCLFMAKFLSDERSVQKHPDKIRKVIETAQGKESFIEKLPKARGFSVKQLSDEYADEMAKMYKEIFVTYPFDIFNPEYIKKTMAEDVDYYGVLTGRSLMALSSSEMDVKNLNTEMTDFVTLPEFRGHNFSCYLLKQMEIDARAKGLKTAYTIARAFSYGMNIVFGRMGYTFAGTLVNNTFIGGEIESMNVWYKPL